MGSTDTSNSKTLLGSLVSVALALTSFVATASSVRTLVPLPSQGTIQGKLEHFFEHGDEYDIALFGTSRVFSGLNPVVVEEELETLGVEAKVFNLGLPAVGAYEVDYYFRKILDGDFERLRLVLVEAWWGLPISLDRNAFTQRRVEWHTARQTLAAASAALTEPSWDWRERALQAGGHVQLFGWRLTNYGRAKDMLFPADPELLDNVDATQGHRPWVKGAGHRGEENRGKALSWSRPKVPASEFDTGVDFELYRKQSELARASGLRLVHAMMPGNREPFPVAKLRDQVSRLIDYRPPTPGREGKFAHLVFLNDPALHLDNLHLTVEGAAQFSRLVASDLARILAKGN